MVKWPPCYFNIFFIEIQLKKEKCAYQAPEFGHPNKYNSLPKSQNTSLPTLDQNSIQLFDPAPFNENHIKCYFDAKHSKTGLNWG